MPATTRRPSSAGFPTLVENRAARMSGSMGKQGAGHPFFSVPLHTAASRSAAQTRTQRRGAGGVVRRRRRRGRARRRPRRSARISQRVILAGGTKAWGETGYALYAGVNVPSKVFGELVEQRRYTPRVSAQDIVSMRAAKEDFVIVDGRPFGEYRKMNIPGSICCPNGELVLRIAESRPIRTPRSWSIARAARARSSAPRP